MSDALRRSVIAGATALIVTAGLLQVSWVAPASAGVPGPKVEAPVRGEAGPVKPRRVDPAWATATARPAEPVWPKAGTVEVPARSGSARSASAGKVRLQTFDRAASTRAQVSGPVMKVQRVGGSGPADVVLGYREFAASYGGDWGGRLRAVALPACAVTTPDMPGCRTQTPVPSVNDTEKKTVTAKVDAAQGGTVLALEAEDASAQGTYAATKLSPASSWNVALNSGGMTWNYPIRVPPTPGGLAPQVGLGYSSQTVDGRTTATNNQGSWIGEGFGYEPGYIERRYKPCPDDGHDNVGDQCWGTWNATMVLGGESGDLIRIDGDATSWKLENDSGAKIERIPGATNGDNDGEFWRVTTTDGTQYHFGLNRLPGWTGASGQEETKSAWTVPVYGDDASEPCNSTAGFASSFCDQAWRWNLDYVKDTKGNVISYFYEPETNYYARGAKTDVNGANYHRGGWLRRIDYGQRAGQVYATPAPVRVRFATAERCLPTETFNCSEASLNQNTAAHWPDVPTDRICAPSTRCKIQQASPSFFTRKRLTGIVAEIRSGSSWQPVDSWALTQAFVNNGDASRSLWLSKIQQTGHRGGADLSTPAVELIGEQMANRIDRPDDMTSELLRYRLKTIWTETGGQIDVNYAPTQCAPGNLPKAGESTRRCYPVIWNPVDDDKTVTDWFHKYVVEEIVVTDRTGGNPDMVTRYEYVGDAGWRKNKPDGLTKNSDLTWGDWRGYEHVKVRTGNGQSMPTRVDSFFLRGLHGDPLPGGGTRTVQATDSVGNSYTDVDEWSAHPLETITYDGSTVISKTINKPWRHHTLTRTESWGTEYAALVRTAETRNYTALAPAAGGAARWRETRSSTTHETTFGRATEVEDLGDVSRGDDDRCIRTWHADNPSLHLYSLTKRTETLSVHCGVTDPDRSKQVISDTRTFYDGKDYEVPPTKGVVSKGEELAAHDGTTPTYVSVGEATVDDYGRTLDERDAAGNVATTRYVDVNGLNTQTTTTNAMKHATVTTVDPSLGVPTVIVDANSKRTDLRYDALGRLTDVWLPNRSRASNQTPSIKYGYLVRTDKTLVIRTEKLRNDGTYRPSYELLDGLTRVRQTQQPGPDGGWLIGDFFYTGTGQVAKTNTPYHVLGTPGDQPIVVPEGEADGQTSFVYDGADRVTAEIFSVAGDARWSTTTRYGGDRTHIDPPRGATPTTTVTDARGNKVEVHQYHGDGPSGAADVSRYSYTPAGQLATMTDAADNVWRYTYNQLGQKIEDVDPDRGTTTYEYDRLGRLEYVTDARQQRLKYVYDALGRKTQTWQVRATGDVKRAESSYDGLAKGALHWSARYVDGQAYGVTYSNLDTLYRPQKTTYSIPAGAGAELAKSYEFTKVYNLDDTVQSVGSPAAGGLPAEAMVTTYDDLLRPTGLSSGAGTYVTGTSYARTGQLMRLELSTGNGRKAIQNWTYERGTSRVLTAKLDRPHAATVDADVRYDYDEAGNILAARDTPAGGARDIQCFTYDHLRRLTEAWSTDNSNEKPCAGGPAVSGVGGPAAYHQSWEIDEVGNRTSETIHGTGGTADTVRTYRYPGAGAVRPHAVTAVEESGPGGAKTLRYRYDNAGNTDCRPSGQATNDCATGAGSQALTWDAEGKLAAAGSTGFVYDGEGKRLLRKEPNATTLFLPGMELRLDHATKKVTGTRSYMFGDRTVATRGPGGVTFHSADQQGTAQTSIDATTGAITWRRNTPYGGPRGSQPSAWPDERGFVGGFVDASAGLTQLGARPYDAAIGKFISVDTLLDTADPQQWNGFAYANNNPVSMNDTSGLRNDPYSTPDGSTNDDGNLPDNRRPGGGGNNPSGGRSNPYASDDEERASTGDPARARELRRKRFQQIKQGRFDFSHLFEQIDVDINGKCRGIGRLICHYSEEWTEDQVLDAVIESTLDRIDESRTINGKEFGFSDDFEFRMAFELAWEGMRVESRGDGGEWPGVDDMPAVGSSDDKGFDAYVDGVRSEFKWVGRKQPTNTSNAVQKAFNRAKDQHANTLYIRVNGTDSEKVNGGMGSYYRSNTQGDLKKVMVWGTDSDGDHWAADVQPISENIDCEGWDWLKC